MWVVLAALAVSGFAAFQPDEADGPPPGDPTTRAEVTGIAPSAIYDFEPPSVPWVDPVVSPETSTTSPPTTAAAAPTTTIAPTTTAAPTTTIAPTTTSAPTTTVAPTTTTTAPSGTETTTPTETSHPPAAEAWRFLVEAHFPASEVELALTVLWCESRGDPIATNPSSGAAGLFQHIPLYWPDRSAKAGFAGANIYDPTANVGVAAYLVVRDGWKHWYPSSHCWG